ncbi:eukaryotic translation initiation factor 4G-like [Phragmites australis]|uniref:eukaryotic translation initiation factor 4G-like n=1 Tax=Phragmites australis TaxID=29695 RepID=UPI002D79B87C|nr:eukaryotic translation initiation factor 4G-like [Phragmites australis]
MSQRGDRGEGHARRPGRSSSFGGHRGGGVGGAGKGGGGPSGQPPLSSNRSFRKPGNGHGGHQRVVSQPDTTGFQPAPAPRPLQTPARPPPSPQNAAAHIPLPVPRPQHHDPQVLSVSPATENPANTQLPKNTPHAAPRVPPKSSNPPVPQGPLKGEPPKGFNFQFGSINMNGIPQFPARTSSAPPNLDEQKRNQALLGELKGTPSTPVQPALKQQQLQQQLSQPQPLLQQKQQQQPQQPQQQQTRKDAVGSSHPNSVNPHISSQVKRDVHVSPSVPNVAPLRPTVQSISGMTMSIPFQFGGHGPQMQPQVPLQFGGHGPQMQPQVVPSSLQMSMGLTGGNAPQVPQQLYVPTIHQLQQQAMMQGQGIGYVSSAGHQFPPQLGNIPMSIAPQYTQTRKTTVKITHPDTHEELKLDKRMDSSGQRASPNLTPQSQPVSSYNPLMGFYHQSSIYYPPTTGVSQVATASSGPRFNYPVTQSGQAMTYISPSAGPVAPGQSQITVKPYLGGLQTEKSGTHTVTISAPPGKSDALKLRPAEDAAPNQQKDEEVVSGITVSNKSAHEKESKAPSEKHPTVVSQSLPVQGVKPETSVTVSPVANSVSPMSGTEGKNKETIQRTESFKDNRKNATKKDARNLSQQPQPASSAEDFKVQTSVKVGGDGGDHLEAKNTSSSSASMVALSESRISPVAGTAEVDSTPVNAVDVPGTDKSSAKPASEGTGEPQGVESFAVSAIECEESKRTHKVPTDPCKDDISSDVTERESPEVSAVDMSVQASAVTPNTDNSDATPHVTDQEQSLKESTLSGSEEQDIMNGPSKNSETLSDFLDGNAVAVTTSETSESDVQSANDKGDSDISQETVLAVSSVTLVASEAPQKSESMVDDQPSGAPTVSSRPVSREKPGVEITRTKSTAGKKKKRKEMLSKADAAGTSDLYNAYKGPEEKLETIGTAEDADSSSTVDATVLPDESEGEVNTSAYDGKKKVEPDDWEDAADMSTPKLQSSDSGDQAGVTQVLDSDTTEANGRKKYSRDFLLTLSQHCTGLPFGFQLNDVATANALMNNLAGKSYIVDREPHPSPGRGIDRPGSRGDRRGAAMADDRWTKSGVPLSPGLDTHMDLTNGPSIINYRGAPGVNHGVLRNPRGQPSSHHGGGLLVGPMQSIGPQIPRSGSDADRWQQKGLMPSPVTPMQTMHKAERKYVIGKVSDEEEAKQRQLKGILNKLTPQNFEKLFEQVKEVNIDNVATLTGVISQIFDKALMEPTFCEMYANFCVHLASALPDFSEDNEKITFKRLLLNKCQEEFERGEREEAEADKTEEDGEIKQTKEEREEKRIRARRRMLGNIRLIGELYKKRMLTERIMHECIKKLLGNYQDPDEENIEALCKLMGTIGEMIDHAKAKEHMDAYFDILQKMSISQKLSSRVRFMLRDSIDLRKNKWQQRRKVEGPKKIEEVHRDAAQERHAQTSRLGRGSVSSAPRRGPPPMDYGTRGSALASQSSQQGSTRGMPPHSRGFGSQDIRFDERRQFDNRTVPLPQRPVKDEPITLGPQGGLARGMSIRGQSLASNAELPSVVDHRRMVSGSNGYNSVADRTSSTGREDPSSRIPDRTSGRTAASTQSAGLSHRPASQEGRSGIKSYSEDDLREKSVAAIREYYSAKDEKEVALCIEELNAPSFYPSVVSLWVNDSFERKDMERELLAKLFVSLCNGRHDLLSKRQLIDGLAFVLASLEDTLSDAPRATEYLGRLLARFVQENILPLQEVGRLIQEGGEEPGYLVRDGIAADILGAVLEAIKLGKGDSFLNEAKSSSNLKLEDFRPQHLKRSKLDAFM